MQISDPSSFFRIWTSDPLFFLGFGFPIPPPQPQTPSTPMDLTYVTGRKIEEDSSYVTGFLRGNSNFNTNLNFAPKICIMEYGNSPKVHRIRHGVQSCSRITAPGFLEKRMLGAQSAQGTARLAWRVNCNTSVGLFSKNPADTASSRNYPGTFSRYDHITIGNKFKDNIVLIIA